MPPHPTAVCPDCTSAVKLWLAHCIQPQQSYFKGYYLQYQHQSRYMVLPVAYPEQLSLPDHCTQTNQVQGFKV